MHINKPKKVEKKGRVIGIKTTSSIFLKFGEMNVNQSFTKFKFSFKLHRYNQVKKISFHEVQFFLKLLSHI